MQRKGVRCLVSTTFVVCCLLAGCGEGERSAAGGSDGGAAPSAQASGTALVTARGRIAVDGGTLEAVTMAEEPLPVGAALRPRDPIEAVTVTARNDAPSPTLVVVVGRTVPSAAALVVHAWVDGQPVENEVDITPAPDGTAQEGGVALVLATGETATITVSGAEEGVVLVGEAEGAALFDTLTSSDTRGLTVPSWLRLWVLQKVAKGLTCFGIEAILKGQGMVCLDKPWWLPNPLCLWQAVFCGYPAQ